MKILQNSDFTDFRTFINPTQDDSSSSDDVSSNEIWDDYDDEPIYDENGYIMT